MAMKHIMSMLFCVLLATLPIAAFGMDTGLEASMIVMGTITLNPDGSVYAYSLDQQDELPKAVVELIGKTVSGWRFAPVIVGGTAVRARTIMSLRIVARPVDSSRAVARIEGATFGRETAQSAATAECARNSCLTYDVRTPPRFPGELVSEGVSGVVYTLVEVNHAGKVARAAVQQVDLRVSGFRGWTRGWRLQLSDAVMEVARGWTFHVPTTGDEADKDHWIVRIPVDFSFVGHDLKYGQWDVYNPGPVHDIPWADKDSRRAASSGSADAIPNDGQPFVADTRFVLLTPVGGGAPRQSPGPPGQG
jgi:hypothetical protein